MTIRASEVLSTSSHLSCHIGNPTPETTNQIAQKKSVNGGEVLPSIKMDAQFLAQLQYNGSNVSIYICLFVRGTLL